MATPEGPQGTETKPGIGFGIFLVLAGIVLLGGQLGWIPQQLDWLFPVILIAWGGGLLYRRFNGE